MNEKSGIQLIRQGAYTAVGGLMVYGTILLITRIIQARTPQPAQQTCACSQTA